MGCGSSKETTTVTGATATATTATTENGVSRELPNDHNNNSNSKDINGDSDSDMGNAPGRAAYRANKAKRAAKAKGEEQSNDGGGVNEQIKNITSRPTVADQHVAGGKKRQSIAKQKAGAHHLKNVFARPLEDVESFKAPSYAKTKTEELFLKNAILKNFVFSNMSPKEMKTMVSAFEKQTIEAGTVIIKQGDTGDYFYVIESGTVTFEVNGKKVGTAPRGHTFGELSLLYTCPRAATVTADEQCVLYRVEQRTFRLVLLTQTMETQQNMVKLLKNVPFLKELDDRDLNKMIGTITPRTFKAGEYLVKKGEEGDALYVIQEGQVKVTDISIGGQSYENQVLSSGEFFGERALMTQEPRAANCIGASDGIALCITAEIFETVMGDLTNLITKATDKRKLVSLYRAERQKDDGGNYCRWTRMAFSSQTTVLVLVVLVLVVYICCRHATVTSRFYLHTQRVSYSPTCRFVCSLILTFNRLPSRSFSRLVSHRSI